MPDTPLNPPPPPPPAVSPPPPPPGHAGGGSAEAVDGPRGAIPTVPVIVGIAVAALVVVGLLVALGGTDSDGFGNRAIELSAARPVDVSTLDLERGQAVRFRVVPRSGDAELVLAVALDRDTALALVDEILAGSSDDFSDDFSDNPSGDDALAARFQELRGALPERLDRGYDFDAGDYYLLFKRSGRGAGIADTFVAPVSGRFALVTFNDADADTNAELAIEQWDGRASFSAQSDYWDSVDQLSDDPFFAQDEAFFTDASDYFSDAAGESDPGVVDAGS